MKIRHDEKADAMYIRFGTGSCFESDELREGLIADYDKNGKLVGLEILDVLENLPKGTLAEGKKPEVAKVRA